MEDYGLGEYTTPAKKKELIKSPEMILRDQQIAIKLLEIAHLLCDNIAEDLDKLWPDLPSGPNFENRKKEAYQRVISSDPVPQPIGNVSFASIMGG